ncbi:MAG: hypothetical protein K8S00_09830 [Bacteroidales bacterium]|nr:hypothetical protein [Bacteroidales bacterium]
MQDSPKITRIDGKGVIIIQLMEATEYFKFIQATDDGRLIFLHHESESERQIKSNATVTEVQNFIYEFAYYEGKVRGKNEVRNNIKTILGITTP